MLKYTKKKFVEVSDWDELVETTYGRPYSLQQQDGCKGRGIEEIEAPSLEEANQYKDGHWLKSSIPEEVNGREMCVRFDAWLARDPKTPLASKDEDEFGLKLFWLRNFYPTTEAIAADLVKRGLLEPGDYTIVIDW